MGKTQLQWIPCSERMPETGVTVLIWLQYPEHLTFATTGYSFGDGYWHRDSDPRWLCIPGEYIPYWCPIPPAPK